MSRYLLLISVIFLFSCKKDKLKDDKEIFIGNWKWVYSIKSERFACDNPAVITILNPTSVGADYYLDFNKKGCATFYQNTEKKEKYRLVFTAWDFGLNPYTNYYTFGIRLDNDDKEVFDGYVKSDTLIDRGKSESYE